MKITIWSSISGPTSGYATIDAVGSCTVVDLLHAYCQRKGLVQPQLGWQLCKSGTKILPLTHTLDQCGIRSGDQLILTPGM